MPEPLPEMDLQELGHWFGLEVPEEKGRWPPIEEECTKEPEGEVFMFRAGEALQSKPWERAAESWEKRIREMEKSFDCYEWSFQQTLNRPWTWMLSALKEEEVGQQQQGAS